MSLGTRIRGSLAAILSAALMVSGALLAAPAASAVEDAPVVSASVSGIVDATSMTVSVSATGLPSDIANLYAALVVKGADPAQGYTAFATPFPTVSAGASNFTLTATVAASVTPARLALVAGAQYEVVLWQQHTAASADTIYARADLAISATDQSRLFPPAAPEVTPDAGSDPVPVPGEESGTQTSEVVVPAVTVLESVTNLDPTRPTTVTVRGTGFVPNAPATNGARPPLAGQFGGTYVVFGSFLETWQPSLSAPSSSRVVLQQKWALPQESKGIATTSWVELSADGTFETTLSLAPDAAKALEGGRYGIYTYPGSGAKYAPFETFTPVTFLPVPKLTIDGSVQDLDPSASNTVTVRGSGFVPNPPATSGARPPLAGKFTGVYVAFGSYAPIWQPSTGALAATRVGLDVKWAVPAESMQTIGGTPAGAIELLPDGTFETTLTLTPDESRAVVGGSWGIVTYPGGGSKYAPFETFTPVTFAEPAAKGIAATVSEVTAGSGMTIDVTANGLPDDISFAYVAVFKKPAVAGAQLKMDAFTRVTAGSLSTVLEVPIASLQRGTSYEVVIWKQHSTLNDTNLYLRTDLTVTDAQWDRLFGAAPKPETNPGQLPGPTPAPAALSAGSLRWGVSSSFANYVTGNVAKGSITTSGVGGGRGGYIFPQANGGSWNAQTQTGSVPFSGVVTFTGHNGALSRTVSNPVITVTSASTATISVSGQPFGTLNLAAASKSVGANGEITWSGVPVSGGFGYGQYDLAADALTFTVGAPSGITYGSTTVLSQAQASQNRTAAPAPPATEGIRVITSGDELVAGGEIEFEASGFQPNERNILVVMYSEPMVLDTNAGADENGVVRWIGTLPEGLTGEHTITLQGSINAGKVISIAAPEALERAAATAAETAEAQIAEVQAAGIANASGPNWMLWVGALALLVVAGGLAGLVVSQRRRAAAAGAAVDAGGGSQP